MAAIDSRSELASRIPSMSVAGKSELLKSLLTG